MSNPLDRRSLTITLPSEPTGSDGGLSVHGGESPGGERGADLGCAERVEGHHDHDARVRVAQREDALPVLVHAYGGFAG